MGKTLIVMALGLVMASYADAQPQMRFKAHLDGFNAAGNPVITNATGQANFEVIDNGTAIRYRVNVAGIENLFMAHIHVAPAPVQVTDAAGPIAFWFVPTTPPAGPPAGVEVEERIQGNLTSGLIMWDEQLVGALAPDPENPEGTGIAGLIAAMQEGRASVVVHTRNSPPGELRGTIE